MALCSLSRSNPGNRKEYKRVNGPFTLYMVAGGGNKLPYGNLPRLLLAWVSTEAVRTQSRELILGKSLSEFMRTLGIYNSGGNPQTRLRNQMRRLFHCTVSLIYEDERGAASAPFRLTWRQIYRQFGLHPDKASDKKTVQNFRIKVLRELKKIKLAWPELNYSTAPGVLILHPSIQGIRQIGAILHAKRSLSDER